jgi:hypothetical protein
MHRLIGADVRFHSDPNDLPNEDGLIWCTKEFFKFPPEPCYFPQREGNKVVIDSPYYGSRLTGFADMNADGFADAVVVNDDRVVVRFNDQLGGFGSEQTLSDYPYFGSVATFLGDLNGDGATDLVVYNVDAQVVRYNLDGDGLSPNVKLLLEPR